MILTLHKYIFCPRARCALKNTINTFFLRMIVMKEIWINNNNIIFYADFEYISNTSSHVRYV